MQRGLACRTSLLVMGWQDHLDLTLRHGSQARAAPVVVRLWLDIYGNLLWCWDHVQLTEPDSVNDSMWFTTLQPLAVSAGWHEAGRA